MDIDIEIEKYITVCVLSNIMTCVPCSSPEKVSGSSRTHRGGRVGR